MTYRTFCVSPQLVAVSFELLRGRWCLDSNVSLRSISKSTNKLTLSPQKETITMSFFLFPTFRLYNNKTLDYNSEQKVYTSNGFGDKISFSSTENCTLFYFLAQYKSVLTRSEGNIFLNLFELHLEAIIKITLRKMFYSSALAGQSQLSPIMFSHHDEQYFRRGRKHL